MGAEALLDALESIDPVTLEYSEFVEIGMALKHEGLPFEAWDAWAARDAARYKALGNSMAVPCMRWIGERIQMVDEILGGEVS